MGGGFWGLMIIGGIFAAIGQMVSSKLKSKFEEYSRVPISSGLTGKQIAEKMLNDNGIYDVDIISVQGQLTDHYNPMKRTVNLSEPVYNSNSIAAAAVAAHEVGHAIQHAQAYPWLQFRSSMVPLVNFASKSMRWVLMAGIAITAATGLGLPMYIAVALFGATALFSVITLPVEYDASNRALEWLNTAKLTNGQEHAMASDALKWAARTYLVAAMAALAQLLYLISIVMRRR